MTVSAIRTSVLNATLYDLIAIWVALTAALVYFEVPVFNAPLFATALVMQSALGTVVMTQLLRDVKASLLMICGPGLILGGALSFTIFQITGRGVLGAAVTILAGFAGTAVLVCKINHESTPEPRWWMLGQMMGLGALAVAREFTEMLPAVLVLFTLGYITDLWRRRHASLVFASVTIGTFVVIAVLPLRKDYWWLISDDYKLFEVVSRHLTAEGPFADWGTSNFARYHWLSYGWSGLLNLLGGSPEPLVTLSKVMPIAYATSIASSIAFVAMQLCGHTRGFVAMLPAWAIVAIGPWDWAGTSTAGVYAVLAAFIVVTLLAVTRVRPDLRFLVLVLAFFPIIALTKLPSVFALLVATWAGILVTCFKVPDSPLRFMFAKIAVVPCVLGFVWFLSRALGSVGDEKLVEFRRVGPGGQLSLFGPRFVLATLILSKLFLYIVIAWIGFQSLRSSDKVTVRRWLIDSASLGLFLGLILSAFLHSSSGNASYFTEPMYFLSSLGLLVLPDKHLEAANERFQRRASWRLVLLMLLAGLLWTFTPFSNLFWDFTTRVTGESQSLRIQVLRFVTAERLFGASLVALVLTAWVVTARQSALTARRVISSLVIAAVPLTFIDIAEETRDDFQRGVGAEEIQVIVGSEDEMRAGSWLRNNTSEADLVATNYASDTETSQFYGNYALAVWSHREFLTLGAPTPESRVTSPTWIEAQDAVNEFAAEGSLENCDRIRSLQVRWFVVDLEHTNNRDWSLCSSKAVVFGRFQILSLSPTD